MALDRNEIRCGLSRFHDSHKCPELLHDRLVTFERGLLVPDGHAFGLVAEPNMSSATVAPVCAAQVAPEPRRSWKCRPETPAAVHAAADHWSESRPTQGVALG